jgi:hypothetical protein
LGTIRAMNRQPLGYLTALNVVKLGRAAFFGDMDADLPPNRSPLLRKDDLTPQFGYVGRGYTTTRVLLLGINPGNGRETINRSVTDERMMPALIKFAQHPSPENFKAAQQAYQAECSSWHIWRRHCAEITGAGKLSLDNIAYSNALPWRTGSESKFGDSVAANAATLYSHPLIDELRPSVVICLGKRAAAIVTIGDPNLPHMIVWNRAQAATPSVLLDRRRAAEEVFAILEHHRSISSM